MRKAQGGGAAAAMVVGGLVMSVVCLRHASAHSVCRCGWRCKGCRQAAAWGRGGGAVRCCQLAAHAHTHPMFSLSLCVCCHPHCCVILISCFGTRVLLLSWDPLLVLAEAEFGFAVPLLKGRGGGCGGGVGEQHDTHHLVQWLSEVA